MLLLLEVERYALREFICCSLFVSSFIVTRAPLLPGVFHTDVPRITFDVDDVEDSEHFMIEGCGFPPSASRDDQTATWTTDMGITTAGRTDSCILEKSEHVKAGTR